MRKRWICNRSFWVSTLGASLLSVDLAHASPTPVFYSAENPNIVVGQVVVATGKAPEEFKLMTVAADLHGMEATVEGAPALQACTGDPVGVAGLDEAVTTAEQALDYMESDKVSAALATGAGVMGCLNTALPAEKASRLYFLAGVAAIQEGDKASAWDAFRAAWVLYPKISWDPNFPPDARRVFKLAIEEAQATGSVAVELVVPAPGKGFWIDGQAVTQGTQVLQLFPGNHIVQWTAGEQVQTRQLTIPEGTMPRLAIPALVPDDFARWVATPRSQEAIDPILQLVASEGEALFAVGGGIWKTTVGTGNFEQMVAPTEEIEVDFPDPLDLAPSADVVEEPLPDMNMERVRPYASAPIWARAGTPVLLATGVGFALRARQQADIQVSEADAYDSAMAAGDVSAATTAYDNQYAASRTASLSWAVAGGALVGAGVGAVVTIRFGRDGSEL